MIRSVLLLLVLMQMEILFASELNLQNKLEVLLNTFKKDLYQRTISGQLRAYKDSACSERLSVKEVLELQKAMLSAEPIKHLAIDENWQRPEYILMLNAWKYQSNTGIRSELRALGIAYHYNIEYPRTIKGILFFKKEEALKMLNPKDSGLMLAYLNYLIINDSPIAQTNPLLHESFETYANNYNRDLLNNSQLIYGGRGSMRFFSELFESSLVQYTAAEIHQGKFMDVYKDSSLILSIKPKQQIGYFQKEIIELWPLNPSEGCATFDSVFVYEFTPMQLQVEYIDSKGLFRFYAEIDGNIELEYFIDEKKLLAQVNENLKPILTWLID
jgi:hypothetical protein